MRRQLLLSCLAFILCMPSNFSYSQDNSGASCDTNGSLQDEYCDSDGDMVADLPADPNKWRDPTTLVWAYAPIENPAVYSHLFKAFTNYLSGCVGRQIVYYPVQSNDAEIRAFRGGRLHFAGFSTGAAVLAVEGAGAVPFAVKGDANGVRGYRLIALVRAQSPFKTLADLKGKRVAHSSATSNSGNLAPLVLFPAEGLVPGKDYTPIMSGSHDRSILGVLYGDYDMAAVASDVFDRMVERGEVPRDAFRIIYESSTFPTSVFAYAHDLAPELTANLRQCFFDFSFTPELKEAFNGDDRFVPVDYRKDWTLVRRIIDLSRGSDGQKDPAMP